MHSETCRLLDVLVFPSASQTLLHACSANLGLLSTNCVLLAGYLGHAATARLSSDGGRTVTAGGSLGTSHKPPWKDLPSQLVNDELMITD